MPLNRYIHQVKFYTCQISIFTSICCYCYRK